MNLILSKNANEVLFKIFYYLFLSFKKFLLKGLYLGITSDVITQPNTITQSALLELIDKLNRDDTVNGVLVQLPVPDEIGICISCNTF